jgi:O-antigen/teichoic acid export membrane protein
MKNIIKNSYRVVLSSIITKISNLFILSSLSRLLSKSELGLYNIYINTGTSFNQLLDFGLTIQMQRISAKYNNENKNILGNKIGASLLFLIIINLFFCFLLFLFQKQVASLFFYNNNFNIFLLIPLIFFEGLNQYFLFLMIGFGEFKILNFKNIIYTFSSLFIILFASFYFGYRGALYGYILSSIVNFVFSTYFINQILKSNRIEITINNFFSTFFELLKDGFFYYFGNTLLGSIFGLVTISVFIKFLNIEDFTYLRFSGALNSLINFLPTALLPLMLTYLSKSNEIETFNLKSIQFRYFTFFLVVSSLLIIAFLNPIITLLFGKKYLNGFYIITILTLVNLFTQITNMFSNFLISNGQMNYVGKVSFITILTLIISIYFLVPKYGVNAYLICYLLTQLASLILVFIKENTFSFFDIRDTLKLFFPLNLLVITLSIIIKYFTENKILEIYFILFILISYIIIFYKKHINISEKRIINNLNFIK